MPAFSAGQFHVRLPQYEPFVKGHEVSFGFFPVNTVVWLLLIIFCLAFCRSCQGSGQGHRFNVYWVVLPAAIGVGISLFIPSLEPALLPMETLTLALLMQSRSSKAWAIPRIYLAACLVVGVYLILSGYGSQLCCFVPFLSLGGGLIVFYPQLIMYLFSMNGISSGKLAIGLLVSAVLPIILTIIGSFAFVTAVEQTAPWQVYVGTILFWGFPALGFCLLVLYNVWVRAVVTGTLGREGASDGEVQTSQLEPDSDE